MSQDFDNGLAIASELLTKYMRESCLHHRKCPVGKLFNVIKKTVVFVGAIQKSLAGNLLKKTISVHFIFALIAWFIWPNMRIQPSRKKDFIR